MRLPRSRRPLPAWTDERTEAELRRLTAGTDRWPSKREFEKAGLASLHNAIKKRGTRHLWAKKLGLNVPGGRITTPTRWTEEAIERALRPLLEAQPTA